MTNSEICTLLRLAHDALSISSMPPKREWVWLTNEEVDECLQALPTKTIDIYARRLEIKIKEKNT